MAFYSPLLVIKFIAVLAYAGGLAGTFFATAPEAQRRAVHRVASPALLVVWGTGYGLSTLLRVPLTELWLLAALVLSLVSQLVLVYVAARDARSWGTFLAATLPILMVLVLMVYRPRWSDF